MYKYEEDIPLGWYFVDAVTVTNANSEQLGQRNAILDSNGNVVVQYKYDAWGNHKVLDAKGNALTSTTHIGNLNPFRYRSYYFDTETKLYFLKTRYYDPEVGRFINMDSLEFVDPETINGLNLFAYCNNNPVMGYDPEGSWNWSKFLKITAIVVSTVAFTAAVVASAGAVGALAGVGAAALGVSSSAVAAISTAATVGTYIVAGGVAAFGLSDAIEVGTDGYNPIRDELMGGNQTAYDITHTAVDFLGSAAVFAGSFAPEILQNSSMLGQPSREGYTRDFWDNSGNWNARIDSTVHGNPKYHHNPHVHFGNRSGGGKAVYYFWEVIKKWFGK